MESDIIKDKLSSTPPVSYRVLTREETELLNQSNEKRLQEEKKAKEAEITKQIPEKRKTSIEVKTKGPEVLKKIKERRNLSEEKKVKETESLKQVKEKREIKKLKAKSRANIEIQKTLLQHYQKSNAILTQNINALTMLNKISPVQHMANQMLNTNVTQPLNFDLASLSSHSDLNSPVPNPSDITKEKLNLNLQSPSDNNSILKSFTSLKPDLNSPLLGLNTNEILLLKNLMNKKVDLSTSVAQSSPTVETSGKTYNTPTSDKSQTGSPTKMSKPVPFQTAKESPLSNSDISYSPIKVSYSPIKTPKPIPFGESKSKVRRHIISDSRHSKRHSSHSKNMVNLERDPRKHKGRPPKTANLGHKKYSRDYGNDDKVSPKYVIKKESRAVYPDKYRSRHMRPDTTKTLPIVKKINPSENKKENLLLPSKNTIYTPSSVSKHGKLSFSEYQRRKKEGTLGHIAPSSGSSTPVTPNQTSISVIPGTATSCTPAKKLSAVLLTLKANSPALSTSANASVQSSLESKSSDQFNRISHNDLDNSQNHSKPFMLEIENGRNLEIGKSSTTSQSSKEILEEGFEDMMEDEYKAFLESISTDNEAQLLQEFPVHDNPDEPEEGISNTEDDEPDVKLDEYQAFLKSIGVAEGYHDEDAERIESSDNDEKKENFSGDYQHMGHIDAQSEIGTVLNHDGSEHVEADSVASEHFNSQKRDGNNHSHVITEKIAVKQCENNYTPVSEVLRDNENTDLNGTSLKETMPKPNKNVSINENGYTPVSEVIKNNEYTNLDGTSMKKIVPKPNQNVSVNENDCIPVSKVLKNNEYTDLDDTYMQETILKANENISINENSTAENLPQNREAYHEDVKDLNVVLRRGDTSNINESESKTNGHLMDEVPEINIKHEQQDANTTKTQANATSKLPNRKSSEQTVNNRSESERKPLSCEKCQKRFRLSRLLDHHMKSEHSIEAEMLLIVSRTPEKSKARKKFNTSPKITSEITTNKDEINSIITETKEFSSEPEKTPSNRKVVKKSPKIKEKNKACKTDSVPLSPLATNKVKSPKEKHPVQNGQVSKDEINIEDNLITPNRNKTPKMARKRCANAINEYDTEKENEEAIRKKITKLLSLPEKPKSIEIKASQVIPSEKYNTFTNTEVIGKRKPKATLKKKAFLEELQKAQQGRRKKKKTSESSENSSQETNAVGGNVLSESSSLDNLPIDNSPSEIKEETDKSKKIEEKLPNDSVVAARKQPNDSVVAARKQHRKVKDVTDASVITVAKSKILTKKSPKKEKQNADTTVVSNLKENASSQADTPIVKKGKVDPEISVAKKSREKVAPQTDLTADKSSVHTDIAAPKNIPDIQTKKIKKTLTKKEVEIEKKSTKVESATKEAIPVVSTDLTFDSMVKTVLNTPFKEKKFKCKSCDAEFWKEQELTKHTLIHKFKTYDCYKCEEKFTTMRALTKHLLIHNETPRVISSTRPHDCDRCGEKFETENQLLVHLQIHNMKELDHVCAFCSAKYHSLSELYHHITASHPEGMQQVLRCNICGTCFKNLGDFRIHLMKEHQMNSKQASLACRNKGIIPEEYRLYEEEKRRLMENKKRAKGLLLRSGATVKSKVNNNKLKNNKAASGIRKAKEVVQKSKKVQRHLRQENKTPRTSTRVKTIRQTFDEKLIMLSSRPVIKTSQQTPHVPPVTMTLADVAAVSQSNNPNASILKKTEDPVLSTKSEKLGTIKIKKMNGQRNLAASVKTKSKAIESSLSSVTSSKNELNDKVYQKINAATGLLISIELKEIEEIIKTAIDSNRKSLLPVTTLERIYNRVEAAEVFDFDGNLNSPSSDSLSKSKIKSRIQVTSGKDKFKIKKDAKLIKQKFEKAERTARMLVRNQRRSTDDKPNKKKVSISELDSEKQQGKVEPIKLKVHIKMSDYVTQTTAIIRSPLSKAKQVIDQNKFANKQKASKTKKKTKAKTPEAVDENQHTTTDTTNSATSSNISAVETTEATSTVPLELQSVKPNISHSKRKRKKFYVYEDELIESQAKKDPPFLNESFDSGLGSLNSRLGNLSTPPSDSENEQASLLRQFDFDANQDYQGEGEDAFITTDDLLSSLMTLADISVDLESKRLIEESRAREVERIVSTKLDEIVTDVVNIIGDEAYEESILTSVNNKNIFSGKFVVSDNEQPGCSYQAAPGVNIDDNDHFNHGQSSMLNELCNAISKDNNFDSVEENLQEPSVPSDCEKNLSDVESDAAVALLHMGPKCFENELVRQPPLKVKIPLNKEITNKKPPGKSMKTQMTPVEYIISSLQSDAELFPCNKNSSYCNWEILDIDSDVASIMSELSAKVCESLQNNQENQEIIFNDDILSVAESMLELKSLMEQDTGKKNDNNVIPEEIQSTISSMLSVVSENANDSENDINYVVEDLLSILCEKVCEEVSTEISINAFETENWKSFCENEENDLTIKESLYEDEIPKRYISSFSKVNGFIQLDLSQDMSLFRSPRRNSFSRHNLVIKSEPVDKEEVAYDDLTIEYLHDEANDSKDWFRDFPRIEPHLRKSYSCEKNTNSDRPQSELQTLQSEYPVQGCRFCQISDRSSSSHAPINHYALTHPYNCINCRDRFTSYSDYMLHECVGISNSNKLIRTPLKCKFCSMNFSERKHLNTHEKTHENIFSCYLCKYSAISKRKLHTHFSQKHSVNSLSRSWKDVLKLCSSRGPAPRHQSAKSYGCFRCGLKFTQEKALKRHELFTHANGNSYKCLICARVFLRPYYLQQHMKIHDGILPFRCLTCSKLFRNQSILYKHTRECTKKS